MPSRGIRNNNPGNIRKSNDPWQGLAKEQKDPAFFTFVSPEYGIRAMARILITYYDKHKADTINRVIARWAPPNENDTQAYANFVSKKTGIATGAVIDLQDYYYLSRIIPAMIDMENKGDGCPYTKAQIDRGLALAGVTPARAKATITESKTIQAGTVATASTGGAATVEVLQQAADQVSMLTPYLEIAKWAFLALTLAAVGFMIYRRWDESRRLQR